MAKLTAEIILLNLAEAREQIEQLEQAFKSASPPGIGQYQVNMQHAFHHLNFAWNARCVPLDRYRNLTQEDFDAWGQLPSDLYDEDIA